MNYVNSQLGLIRFLLTAPGAQELQQQQREEEEEEGHKQWGGQPLEAGQPAGRGARRPGSAAPLPPAP